MKVLGLTGGIASGKSAVSMILREFGGYILDADEISHLGIVKGESAYIEIIGRFGAAILDENKEINRRALADIVFRDAEKLRELERITHRYVMNYIKEALIRLRSEGTYAFAVIDAPLLIEANAQLFCDEVWIVYCDTELRIRRLAERNGYTRDEALKRINAQTPFDTLRQKADAVLENMGSLEDLRNVVEKRLVKFLDKPY